MPTELFSWLRKEPGAAAWLAMTTAWLTGLVLVFVGGTVGMAFLAFCLPFLLAAWMAMTLVADGARVKALRRPVAIVAGALAFVAVALWFNADGAPRPPPGVPVPNWSIVEMALLALASGGVAAEALSRTGERGMADATLGVTSAYLAWLPFGAGADDPTGPWLWLVCGAALAGLFLLRIPASLRRMACIGALPLALSVGGLVADPWTRRAFEVALVAVVLLVAWAGARLQRGPQPLAAEPSN